MLVGIVAINVLDVIPLDDDRALGVLLVGYVFQGESGGGAGRGWPSGVVVGAHPLTAALRNQDSGSS